ncbi:hypothetical protein BC829DRAFT_442414 [Chytridium lagenaria]|nr:hypothetical protein BC829DRAFT_442414 [Chytridium lagenaria]
MVRINSQMLQSNVNKVVHVVGRVAAAELYGNIETYDEGHVNVRLQPGSRIDQGGLVVEIVGMVGHDLVVDEQTSTAFKETTVEFDHVAYGRLNELSAQFPELF